MLNFRLISVLLLLWVSSQFSQVVYIEDWLGKWEATYDISTGIRTGTVKEQVVIEEIHKKRFVHFAIQGGFLHDSIIEFKYSMDIFLTFDLEAKDFNDAPIKGTLIDVNGYKGMMNLSGNISMSEINKITLEGECSLWRMVSVWQLKDDGYLYREQKLSIKKTGDESITNAVFKRN